MGAGGSLEAGFTLQGPIAAGTWHLVGDGIISDTVDVTFEVIWRTAGADTVLATFEQHFEPLPNGLFDATPYEADAQGIAAPAAPGDRLILRFTGRNSTENMAYVPNGDGFLTDGRIPNLTLP